MFESNQLRDHRMYRITQVVKMAGAVTNLVILNFTIHQSLSRKEDKLLCSWSVC